MKEREEAEAAAAICVCTPHLNPSTLMSVLLMKKEKKRGIYFIQKDKMTKKMQPLQRLQILHAFTHRRPHLHVALSLYE